MDPEVKQKILKIIKDPQAQRELIVAGTATTFALKIFGPDIISFAQGNIMALSGMGLITVATLMYALNSEKPIDKKIEQVFRNTGTGVSTANGEHLYPQLVHMHKTQYGHKLIYSVPPGLCDVDFWKVWRELEFATKSEIEIYEQNHKIHLKAYSHDLPSNIDMPELEEVDRSASEGKLLPIYFGKSRQGIEWLSVTAAQHILNAGETGGGKTNLFRVMAVNLSWQDNVDLYCIDVKRNLGFLRKHSWFACEDADITAMVLYLTYEMNRRYDMFDALGIDSIEDMPEGSALKYVVLIIDEFSAISPALAPGKEEKDFRNEIIFRIVDLVNRGRGAGIFLFIGIQRPDADLMKSMIKSQISVRFAFRTVDDTNSRIILDKPHAALLPADIPGRCMLRGRDRLRQVQIFNLPLKKAKLMLPVEPRTKPLISLGDKSGVC